MNWVLLLIFLEVLNVVVVATETIRFATEDGCKAALEEVKRERNVDGYCFKALR